MTNGDQQDDGEVHAAIDIGTNSIHLLVARLAPDGNFDIITREKESVRLGSGAGDMDEMSADAINRGIAALQRFRQVAEISHADITAVATSAVREAANRAEFVRRARDEAGITVDVIPGVEEARLIYLGVLQALQVFDRQILVVDIGGGSTELVVGRSGRALAARSLKLGAIRLTDGFFPEGQVRRKSVDRCRTHVRAFLRPVVRDLDSMPRELCVGSSGTIGAIATLIEHQHDRTPRTLNSLTFSRSDLAPVVDAVLGAPTTEDRAALPGMDLRRVDLMPAGVILLEQIFDEFGIEQMTVSEYALREGLFLDRFRRRYGELAFHHLADIRLDSVVRMAEMFDEDRVHVGHATDLALALFDETEELHELGVRSRDLLEAAGLLHNVGLFISHSAHHKHSYYVIRNSEDLVGYTDREIELIALIARYHRKSEPKSKHLEFAALVPDDQREVRLLAGMLRLGIALDRGHAGAVADLHCLIGPERIEVELVTTGDADLELYSAVERQGLLSDGLARELRFEVVRVEPDAHSRHPSWFGEPQ